MCHVYTKQLKVSKIIEIECDLSEFHNQMGQAHISLLNYFLASVAKIFHNQVQGLIIMKLEACGYVLVVSTLVDAYSKLCGHVGEVDTYSKLASLDFALWVLKNWVIFIVQNELSLITSIKFLSGPSPLSREESQLLNVAVIQDSFLSIPFNWKIYFIYHDDSQGRGEAAVEHMVVFPLCDWGCSNGEGPRNSIVDRNLKVFFVLIHYLHCTVNVVMKPVLWMIGNYGTRVGKHYDPYALPEFEYFDYRGLVAEEKTMAARAVVGVSDYYFIVIDPLHATINTEAKAKWQPWIAFQNYHVSKEHFPIFGALCEFGDIQDDRKRKRRHNIMVVTPLYEYFLLDDMFELNRSIEDLGASEFTSMILKKHLILDLNRKILAKNIALTLLSFIHIGNYPRVVVIYGMIIPLSVEVSNCICETVFADRLFEGSLSCFKQQNPGDNYLIINYYYYTKRVLMQMVAKAVLLVIKLLELEKGYATSNALMFATTILKSSIMVISWDPGKFNTLMTRVAYQCCLRNSLSIYRLLN
jgi:hypothetical protein